MVFSQEAIKRFFEDHGEETLAEGSAKKGTLLFTGTLGALRCNAEFGSYGASRSSVRQLAQALAREMSSKGIHVAHAIANGRISVSLVVNALPQQALHLTFYAGRRLGRDQEWQAYCCGGCGTDLPVPGEPASNSLGKYHWILLCCSLCGDTARASGCCFHRVWFEPPALQRHGQPSLLNSFPLSTFQR